MPYIKSPQLNDKFHWLLELGESIVIFHRNMPLTDKLAVRWWRCTSKLINIEVKPSLINALAATCPLTLPQEISATGRCFYSATILISPNFYNWGQAGHIPEDVVATMIEGDVFELQCIVHILDLVAMMIYDWYLPNINFQREKSISGVCLYCSVVQCSAEPLFRNMLFLFLLLLHPLYPSLIYQYVS